MSRQMSFDLEMIEILTDSEIEIEETTYSDEKSPDISLNN